MLLPVGHLTATGKVKKFKTNTKLGSIYMYKQQTHIAFALMLSVNKSDFKRAEMEISV